MALVVAIETSPCNCGAGVVVRATFGYPFVGSRCKCVVDIGSRYNIVMNVHQLY